MQAASARSIAGMSRAAGSCNSVLTVSLSAFIVSGAFSATIAAQVGISGHLNIGSKSTLGAKTGVLSDIPENSTYWGMPAFPYKDATRQYAALKKLPALIKEVRALKKELDSSGK